MNEILPHVIFAAGIGQFGILIASALVPFQLDWRRQLAGLPRLHRQLYLVYGGYIVLSIVALGTISILCAAELAAGSGLARAFCAYAAVFWGIRLSLQAVLDTRPYLTHWWLRLGYHALTVLFLGLTATFGYGALHRFWEYRFWEF